MTEYAPVPQARMTVTIEIEQEDPEGPAEAAITTIADLRELLASSGGIYVTVTQHGLIVGQGEVSDRYGVEDDFLIV